VIYISEKKGQNAHIISRSTRENKKRGNEKWHMNLFRITSERKSFDSEMNRKSTTHKAITGKIKQIIHFKNEREMPQAII